MSKSALKRRAKEARSWLFDACFPLWSSAGVLSSGMFAEFLTLEHTCPDHDITRIRVQARQTFMFSEALALGWESKTAQELTQMGVGVLTRHGLRDDSLVGRAINTTTGVFVDDTPDLYDTAFTLYALGAAARSESLAPHAIGGARAILEGVDRQMKDRLHGGYAETLPPPDRRVQNPHMHLLEACLRLHASDPEGDHLERAAELVALMEDKFTAGDRQLLGEFFAPDWSAPKGGAADIVEPGHLMEWVWLLHQYAAISNTELSPRADTFYGFAIETLDDAGRAPLEARRDGTIHDAGRRTWSQTETLKAHLCHLDKPAAVQGAVRAFDTLMDDHLTAQGGWIEHFNAEGEPVVTSIPASSGYHIVLALSELIRLMDS